MIHNRAPVMLTTSTDPNADASRFSRDLERG